MSKFKVNDTVIVENIDNVNTLKMGILEKNLFQNNSIAYKKYINQIGTIFTTYLKIGDYIVNGTCYIKFKNDDELHSAYYEALKNTNLTIPKPYLIEFFEDNLKFYYNNK